MEESKPRSGEKKYIFLRILAPKKDAQGGSVQVRLLQVNCEVNDKSRLEIKRDFFYLMYTFNLCQWQNDNRNKIKAKFLVEKMVAVV